MAFHFAVPGDSWMAMQRSYQASAHRPRRGHREGAVPWMANRTRRTMDGSGGCGAKTLRRYISRRRDPLEIKYVYETLTLLK